MDILTSIKEFSASKSWTFVQGRKSDQNLIDITDVLKSEADNMSEGETMIFLDPIERTSLDDGIQYSGNFMVLTNSALDKSYENKFTDYIEPLIQTVLKDFKWSLNCDFDVLTWRSIEVVNAFDLNADGLAVSFTVKGYN